jgi:hypothetical protein
MELHVIQRYRVFLGHSIQTDFDDVEILRARCERLMQDAWPQRRVYVTAGRDDWNDRMMVLGDWDAWAHEVAMGKMADGSPRYHAIVVPVATYPVGRATRRIVDMALSAGREVFKWDEDSGAFGVVGG